MADELELLKEAGHELADPDETSVGRARAVLQRRIDLDRTQRRRVWRPFRLRWTGTGAIVVLVASAFGFGLGSWLTPSSDATPAFTGIGFLPTPGWTVLQSEVASPSKGSRATVSNIRINAGDARNDVPDATLRRLPPRGVVIVARLSPRGNERVDSRFPPRTLPLRVDDAVPTDLPLGLADLAVVPVRIRSGVAGYNVDVRVYFGGTPSRQTLAAVDRQLKGLVVVANGVTLVVSPRIFRNSSERVSIFGSVSSGKADEKVTIQFKQCGLLPLQFRDRLETTTREGGGFSFAELRPFAPGVSGVFRAVWGDSASAEVAVQQRASVYLQPAGGGRFEVSVSALQQFWRRQVLLQRLERRLGRWVTMRTLVLTEQLGGAGPAPPFATSNPVTTKTKPFRPAVPKGTMIRAVFTHSQARPCYLAGYSQIRRT